MRGTSSNFWRKYEAMQTDMAAACMKRTPRQAQAASTPAARAVKPCTATQIIVVRAA